jgi:glutathione peroxidase
MHMVDLSGCEIAMLDGRKTTMGEWCDKVMLVVNVASRCGLTPQYEALERLQKTYGERGFTVIGFPSNQFLQEMGSGDTIAEYCSTTWGVTFPLTEKVRVNGKHKHSVYAALHGISDETGHSGRVRWNFEKFLVFPDGNAKRYAPTITPDDPRIIEAIESGLANANR